MPPRCPLRPISVTRARARRWSARTAVRPPRHRRRRRAGERAPWGSADLRGRASRGFTVATHGPRCWVDDRRVHALVAGDAVADVGKPALRAFSGQSASASDCRPRLIRSAPGWRQIRSASSGDGCCGSTPRCRVGAHHALDLAREVRVGALGTFGGAGDRGLRARRPSR